MVDPGRDVRRMDSWVSSFFQPSVDHEEKEDRTQDSRPLGLHPSTSRVNGLRRARAMRPNGRWLVVGWKIWSGGG